MPRVCIIGSGPSGLAALHAFLVENDPSIELVCYEKQSDWSGLWNYSWRTGVNEEGDPIHASMYRHLWTNAPKECLEMADYTFDTHFKQPIGSFPPREILRDYIIGRMQQHPTAKSLIQFHTIVKEVKYQEDQFQVTSYSYESKIEQVSTFDYVLCCTGHFSAPHVPEFEGFDTFPGRILHAHDFRNAEEFTGQHVLIIGASYSAEDIAAQCYKFGAKSITLSYRSNPLAYHWPSAIQSVPLLQLVNGRQCVFEGNTVLDNVDTIILCTGYEHSFPFVAKELRLDTSNQLYVDTLYDGIFWPENPKMMYLGMQNQFFSFPMFDVQAWYARDVILQKFKLPEMPVMEKEVMGWKTKQLELDPAVIEEHINFQAEYVQHLLQKSNYPKFDTKAYVQCFMEWVENKQTNILTYRDGIHTSLNTGTMATPPKTPWLQEFDDSYAHFLQ